MAEWKRDTAPFVSAAGLVKPGGTESTEQCLKSGLDPRNVRPRTPPEIKKYRDSFQNQPGLSFIHPGLVNQPLPPPHHRHGVKTTTGDHVGDSMFQVPPTELGDFVNSLKEAKYLSNVREPVGVSYSRNHKLPEETKQNEFPGFGKSSSTSENAKNLIYFDEPIPDNRIISKKSQRAAEPHDYHTRERDVTRQLDREYDWEKAKINPKTHRFGKTEPLEPNGVATALTWADNIEIANKRVQQVQAIQNDYLGRTRELRGAVRGLNPDFAFGGAQVPDEWGAKKCISGAYAPEEQLPDKDLGVSLKKLSKLPMVPAEVDMGGARVYGIPSIRGDLQPPALRSVADGTTNYGDEVNAKGLLYPSTFTFDGVAESEFLLIRSEGEIRVLFERMGLKFDTGSFKAICDRARRDFGALSADSFRHAWNKLDQEEAEIRGGGTIPLSTMERNALILDAVNFN